MSETNRNVRILVVDADASVGKQICEVLFTKGFAVQYSASAARALVMTRRALPHLMIVDSQLDGCRGAEFVDTVRGENYQHEVPVVFLGSGEAHHGASGHRGAGVYYLAKPVNMAVLADLVDEALWMPHLVRCHIDFAAHQPEPKALRARATAHVSSRREPS